MNRPRARHLWIVALLASACAGTETDNPVGDGSGSPVEPPSYESPTDLFPGAPAAPPCVPQPDTRPQHRTLWAQADGWLVGAARRGVVTWVDVSDPAAPAVRSEAPIAGEPLELSVEAGGATTLVLGEVPALRDTEVPDPRDLGGATKLVRFELSSEGAPERVADVEIEGEHWRLQRRGDVYWVMSARVHVEPICDLAPFACIYPSREAIVVTGYRFTGAAFERLQRVELPTSLHAWAVEDGFVALEGDAGGAGGLLHYARFLPDGSLGEPAQLALDASIEESAPMSVVGDLLRVFVRDPVSGGTSLRLYDLSGATPALLASVDAQLNNARAVRFAPSAVYLPSSFAGPAVRIDHADPIAPTAAALPGPVDLAWPLDADGSGDDGLVLGLASPLDTGALTLSLLSVRDGAVETLDTLELPDAQVYDPSGLVDDLAVDGGRVWLPVGGTLRAVAFDAGELELLAPALERPHGEFVVAGDAAFAAERYGLGFVELAGGASGYLDWPGYEDVLAYIEVGDSAAALVRKRDGSLVLRVTRDGHTTTLSVPPVADQLLGAGDRLLVVSTLPASQCVQSGFDCSGYAPGVDVVSLADTPELVAHLPFPGLEAEDDVQHYTRLQLDDGRRVFVIERDATCWSEEECEALGVEPGPVEGVNAVSGECAPPPPGGGAPVPCVTPPPPTVYGSLREQRAFVLDHAADPPRFGEPVISALELAHSRFAEPVVSGQTLLVTRLESDAGPGPGSFGVAPTARFMLDRFTADEGGDLRALPALNVPGYPVVVGADDTTLVTLEPAGDDSGDVVAYALELVDAGAFVRHEQRLTGQLDDFVARGDQLYVLRHTGEGCAATTTLQPLATDDLELGAALELPSLRYHVTDVLGDRLLLDGLAGGFVVVDLADAAAPAVDVYLRPSPWLGGASLAPDALVGIRYGGGSARVDL